MKPCSATKPARDDVPEENHFLLDWYETEYAVALKVFGPDARLLQVQAVGSGKRDVAQDHDRYLAQAYEQEHGGGTTTRTS